MGDDESTLEVTHAASDTLVTSAASEPPVRARPLQRGDTVDRYVILSQLGEGGMGVVYAGYDPELDRKVALKLFHPPADDPAQDRRRARFVREARAMARISHPNVIAIHDVDTVASGIVDSGTAFLSMEFVDGCTLAQWLAVKRRSWREVVAVFKRAGRGLAAAHDCGLVHRDFKPDNVLVGHDGRVRVTDFGLARALDDTAEAEAGAVATVLPSDPLVLSAAVTREGALVGTPAYMAPEQIQRSTVDARSDQWSFCVALYEGLYGERPFKARTLPQLAAAVLEGRISGPPRTSAVPRWLRSVVMRGLAIDPSDRFDSMLEVLDALDRDPVPRRRKLVIAVGIAVVLVGGLGASQILRARQARRCRAEGALATDTWNERREGIGHAFSNSGLPFAEDSWQRVDAQLTERAQQWSQLRRAACMEAEATAVDDPMAEIVGLKLACLDEWLVDREALTRVLLAAGPESVTASLEMVNGLPRIERCGDPKWLLTSVRLPVAVEDREIVESIRARLIEAEALGLAGDFDGALSAALSAQGQAVALGYLPTQAEASLVLGQLSDRSGDRETAEHDLLGAFFDAVRAQHDEVAAQAAIGLAHVVGVEQKRHDQGETWGQHADVAIERAQEPPRLRAALLHELGLIADSRGDYERATELHQTALALRDGLEQALLPEVATSLTALGQSEQRLDRYDDAHAHLERALAIREATVGPDHPETAASLYQLGQLARKQGDTDRAQTLLERTLDIYRSGFGHDHLKVATSLSGLGLLADDLGKYREAEALHREAAAIAERWVGEHDIEYGRHINNLANSLHAQFRAAEALELYEEFREITRAQLGENHPYVSSAIGNIAAALIGLGDTERALPMFREAVERKRRHYGSGHHEVAAALHALGNVLHQLERFPAAVAAQREALAAFERSLGVDHPRTAQCRAALGMSLAETGDRTAAREELESSLTQLERRNWSPAVLAEVELALAIVLANDPHAHDRAASLARSATARFANLGELGASGVEAAREVLAVVDPAATNKLRGTAASLGH